MITAPAGQAHGPTEARLLNNPDSFAAAQAGQGGTAPRVSCRSTRSSATRVAATSYANAFPGRRRALCAVGVLLALLLRSGPPSRVASPNRTRGATRSRGATRAPRPSPAPATASRGAGGPGPGAGPTLSPSGTVRTRVSRGTSVALCSGPTPSIRIVSADEFSGAQRQDRPIVVRLVPTSGPADSSGMRSPRGGAGPVAFQPLRLASVHDELALKGLQGGVDSFQVLDDSRAHIHVSQNWRMGVGAHDEFPPRSSCSQPAVSGPGMSINLRTS